MDRTDRRRRRLVAGRGPNCSLSLTCARHQDAHANIAELEAPLGARFSPVFTAIQTPDPGFFPLGGAWGNKLRTSPLPPGGRGGYLTVS